MTTNPSDVSAREAAELRQMADDPMWDAHAEISKVRLRRVADLLDAQSKLLAEREWRNIASAPKDVLIDIWTVGWGHSPMRVCDCYFDAECREWRTSRPSLHLLCIPERFVTHWMPTAHPPIPTEGNDDV